MSSAHIDTLERLLQASGTVPEQRVALRRLSTELKDRVSKGSSSSFDFFASVLQALVSIRGTANWELRMSCIHDCATFFFIGGFLAQTLEAAQHLNFLARTGKSKLWMRKAHNVAGLVHADAGNIPEALLHYSMALNLAREIDDSGGEVMVLGNLGVALNYGGLYREAIPCLQRAAEIAESSADLQVLRGAALTNLAQSYLYLEEFDKGFAAINCALDGINEPSDVTSAFSRTVREFTFVQLALELGKLALAREHCAMCSRCGQWGNNLRLKAMADIALGLCEIHGGDVERGLHILESTLASSEDIGSARADALIALVKAYDEVNRPEPALGHMRRLLEHIRSTREKGILTLIGLPYQFGPEHSIFPVTGDLRALEYREARLRAQVAEREVINSRIEMLERLAITADIKEEASGEHGYRVGKLSGLLAEEVGWNSERCTAIDLCARLHDIGKIGVPDRILLSSKELIEAERHFMSTHAVIGAELLARSNIPQLRMAEEIARHHHEWWDGTGYPSKLSGKRIPIHARIVALADVFDALTHGRPFAKPWPIDKALEDIRSRRGTQFDPDLTDRFLSLIDRLRAEHSDLDAYLGKAGRNSPFLQARNKIRLMLAEEREQERKATVTGNETRH